MIGQLFFTGLLFAILLYAWSAYRLAPAVGLFSVATAFAGLYFVWMPDHASWLARQAGIGRGVDLIVYTWVVISLTILLNLHLKLRAQMELITALARRLALADAETTAEASGAAAQPPAAMRAS